MLDVVNCTHYFPEQPHIFATPWHWVPVYSIDKKPSSPPQLVQPEVNVQPAQPDVLLQAMEQAEIQQDSSVQSTSAQTECCCSCACGKKTSPTSPAPSSSTSGSFDVDLDWSSDLAEDIDLESLVEAPVDIDVAFDPDVVADFTANFAPRPSSSPLLATPPPMELSEEETW